jgi:hypothetical protein
LILTYLIPCHLITSHKLPTATLLEQYPQLQRLFGQLISSIKLADLAGFDAALLAGESEFVKRRIYLTLERGRDVVVRNLMRKVFIIGGYEPLKEGQTEENQVRRTRIPVAEFAAAVRLSLGQTNGEVLEDDEVECMLANMIYKVCEHVFFDFVAYLLTWQFSAYRGEKVVPWARKLHLVLDSVHI